MAEEIGAREVREGWIDDIELVKKASVNFRIEIKCSAEMEDCWFGTGFGARGCGEKHGGERLDVNFRLEESQVKEERGEKEVKKSFAREVVVNK